MNLPAATLCLCLHKVKCLARHFDILKNVRMLVGSNYLKENGGLMVRRHTDEGTVLVLPNVSQMREEQLPV